MMTRGSLAKSMLHGWLVEDMIDIKLYRSKTRRLIIARSQLVIVSDLHRKIALCWKWTKSLCQHTQAPKDADDLFLEAVAGGKGFLGPIFLECQLHANIWDILGQGLMGW